MAKTTTTPPPFEPQKTIYLIDGSSFLYRAYYSLRPLHTPAGVPVQAVYSFCRMIKHLINRFSPSYLGLVWDTKGPTIRHRMYEAYKATRQAAPSDLGDQKKLILNFADTVGIKNVAQEGYEADDILYSLAQDLALRDNTVILVTSDKDMGQALKNQVVIFDPFKDQIIDVQMQALLLGFPIEKLPFYFALLGDTSDNIPGVRGIGKKGATDLVTQFASLDDLYNNLSSVKKERMRMCLEASKDNAFLSEKLFRLQYIKMDLKKSDFVFDEDNWSKAKPIFEELNFKSMLKELPGGAPEAQLTIEGTQAAHEPLEQRLAQYDFICVNSPEVLDQLCADLKKVGLCAIDTETTGANPLYDDLVGISFCIKKGQAYYVPCGHTTGEQQMDCATILAKLKPILEDPAIKKYLHHVKFDQLVLYHAGIELDGVAFDSLIAARLILKEWQRAGLKALSEFLLGEQMISFDEATGFVKAKSFAQVPLELATRYAAADAHQTFQIAPIIQKQLAEHPAIKKLYDEIEHPLIQVLCHMEEEGIYLDRDYLAAVGVKVTQEINDAVDQIRTLTGLDINLDSPKQVADLLFVKLSLPPQKKSAKGTGFSTDAEVLTTLSALHPVPALILKYRELAKLKGTYIDVLPDYIHPQTGRIHTSFSQTTTATGRLASMNPNLQNIPTESAPHGLEIRAAFKPKQGHLFISADYSQIELRVLAYLSQDENLVQSFISGHDIHAETAARLFNAPLERVTHEQRQIGKRINFSILYGLTPFGLSKDMKIPLKDAKGYIEAYFNQYPGVNRWMAEVIEQVMLTGYVDTHWGRRRYIPTIFEKNRALHEEAKRLAINTKAQGTAAEIMKIGMIKIAEEFKRQKLEAAIVLQIHDEILVSAPEKQVEDVENIVKVQLESVVSWNIPLVVTTRHGSSWKEVTK